MALVLKVWDFGADGLDDDSAAAAELHTARSQLEQEVTRLGGTVGVENHGVQAGDHFTLVLTLAMQLPQTIDSLLSLASKLRTFLKTARELPRFPGSVAADHEALQLLAYAEVRRSNPTFRTDPELVQVMTDGARRFAREAPLNESFEGFPVGTFIFRIPDLDSGRTHIIEVHNDGTHLDHRVRDELTADALAYLSNDATKQEAQP